MYIIVLDSTNDIQAYIPIHIYIHVWVRSISGLEEMDYPIINPKARATGPLCRSFGWSSSATAAI